MRDFFVVNVRGVRDGDLLLNCERVLWRYVEGGCRFVSYVHVV